MKKTVKYIYKFVFVLCLILVIVPCVWAYETVALKFPDNKGWHRARYVYAKKEAIAQYTPSGQSSDNYLETVVYHSFKVQKITPFALLRKQLKPYIEKNNNFKYKMLRNTTDDAMVEWCMPGNPAQCEIVRATRSHEGVIFIHYINKDFDDFMTKKDEWITRITKARLYYSYRRTDYVLDRKTYFEL